MYDYNNPIYNPALAQYMGYPQQQRFQRQEVVKVNGENGARAYQIGANSSALLLDESGAMVWLVTTDGAGYKTVAAFDISPHEQAPVPDYESLETRIARLEELINNGNSVNSSDAEQKSAYITNSANPADDRNNPKRK